MKLQPRGLRRTVITWIAFSFAIFQLYTAGFGALPDIKQRAIHLIFGLSLVVLSFSFRRREADKGNIPLWDIALIALIIIANLNVFFSYEKIYISPGDSTRFDQALGVLLTLLIFDLTRRVLGWTIPALCLLALVYIFFVGPNLPGTWGFRRLSLEYIITSIYYSNNGIYGMLTGLSATLISVFVIFGALLLFAAGGKTFVELALKLAGRFRGGPAKVAVVSSAFFGTVSGSPVANVLMTGSYTIPLMKRLGYPPHFAGAVEAVASTGGAITPPIMAAGAFIMAELLSVPYINIVMYAVIPALLFYICVFSGVHLEALRLGLSRVPENEIPSWRSVLTWAKLGPFLIPIAILLGMLLQGFSITYAGFAASIAVIVLYVLSDISPKGMRERALRLGGILSRGGQAMVELVPLLVCVGILVNLFSITGVLVKLSGLVVEMGETTFFGALLVAAIVPLVLGMAIPPTGAYILSMAVVAPALIKMGIQTVPANMFLFYLSCLAPITPPVCACAFVAARIADTNWFKVSMVAVRLGIIAFVMPFFFVVEPALLALGTPLQIITVTVAGVVGAVLVSAGFFGYLFTKSAVPSRACYLAGGFLLLFPNPITHYVGLAIGVLGVVADAFLKKRGVQAEGELAREKKEAA